MCVVMGGTVCTVGRHVCTCVRVHSIQVLSQYIYVYIYMYIHTYIRLYLFSMYVQM